MGKNFAGVRSTDSLSSASSSDAHSLCKSPGMKISVMVKILTSSRQNIVTQHTHHHRLLTMSHKRLLEQAIHNDLLYV